MNHLVVVIPGIGGSILARTNHRGERVPVWDAGLIDIASTLALPSRLSIAEHPTLTPIGMTRSALSIAGWSAIRGYEGLWNTLAEIAAPDPVDDATGPPVPGATLVAFPYDFRRSIADNAVTLGDTITTRLASLTATRAAHVDRVIIVAHSMGGLIARHWLGVLDGWKVCRALITLGTPHRGAPKALDWLVNGPGAGWLRLGRSAAVLREWPAVYELLPRYPAITAPPAPPAVEVHSVDVRSVVGPNLDGSVIDQSAGGWYPHELPEFYPGFTARAGQAFAVHEDIRHAWEQMPRTGTKVDVVLGWNHGTNQSATWDGSRLRVHETPPPGAQFASLVNDRGDGTVPGFSAVPIEEDLARVAGRRDPAKHLGLVDSAWVRFLIREYEERPHGGAIRSGPTGVMLGVDLADTVESAETVTITVDASRVDPQHANDPAIPVDLSASQAWCTIGAGQPEPMVYDPTGNRFRLEVTAAMAGEVDVRVDVIDVPKSSDLEFVQPWMVLGDT